jgi:hypothetical protein
MTSFITISFDDKKRTIIYIYEFNNRGIDPLHTKNRKESFRNCKEVITSWKTPHEKKYKNLKS